MGGHMKLVTNDHYGGFSLSAKAIAWLIGRGYKHKGRVVDPDYRTIARNHPLLVECVAELGRDANGGCASLSIEEVDESAPWFLDEYDGAERIRYFSDDHGCNLTSNSN
jgi:hypothetical protein